MANTCAICGASINIFQSQKLADGNYLCRKNCCKKAMRNFDLVTATLPQFKMHAAQARGEQCSGRRFSCRAARIRA